jgi:hypothetical protein
MSGNANPEGWLPDFEALEVAFGKASAPMEGGT